MIYVKLALRNVRRTAQDYLIYMVTLVLSVGMFYGFFSLASSYYSAALPIQMHLEILKKVMRIAVPFVGLLAVFMMSYVNSYMLRRKQKEFAVETIIGMEQGTVAFLFFLETLVMGVVAILAGIALGVLVSQAISIVVLQSFGEIYHLRFKIFPDTLLGTVLLFGTISVLMGLKNVYSIRKMKVIQMLQDSRNGTKEISLFEQFGRWTAACAAISMVVLGMMISLLGRVFAYPYLFLRILVISFLAAVFLLAAVCFCASGKRRRGKVGKGVKAEKGGKEEKAGKGVEAEKGGKEEKEEKAAKAEKGGKERKAEKEGKEGGKALTALTICGLAEGILLLASYRVFEALVLQGMAAEGYVFIPPVCALILLAFSMIAFFGNLTWFLSKVVRKPSAAYYKNLFLIGQIKNRMGSSSKTMGIIACVLAASLVLFAYFPVLAVRIESYQRVLSVFDVQVGTMYPAAESVFPSGTLDYDAITAYLEEGGYPVTGIAQGELYFPEMRNPESEYMESVDLRPKYSESGYPESEDLAAEDAGQDYLETNREEASLLAVPLSVYNELRSLSGLEPIRFSEDEYGIAWDNEVMESDIENFNRKVQTIQAGTKTLSKAEGADFQDPVGISLFTCQMSAVYIIPDDAVPGLRMATTFYSANTEYPLSYEFARQFEQEMGAYQRNLGNFPAESAFVRLNILQTSEGTSTMLMLDLIGAYAALVLLVSSFTMLSVQQLTDAIEQKKRFEIIGKLGVDQKGIGQNIRQQMCFWFGLPVLAALICSVGVLAYLIWSSYKTIVAYISLGWICVIFGAVYMVFLLIFGCYFAATYYLFHRSVEEGCFLEHT